MSQGATSEGAGERPINGDTIIDHTGCGYGVFATSEAPDRVFLWRVTDDESSQIATFERREDAREYVRWLLVMFGLDRFAPPPRPDEQEGA